MCFPIRSTLTMTAIGNTTRFLIQQILNSPFINLFTLRQILALGLAFRNLSGLLRSSFRYIVIESQGGYYSRKIDTGHLSISGFIGIRIPYRLPLPEHTSILFVIRTCVSYLIRAIPYPLKTGFCQSEILFLPK